ncbi:MAG: hypothetical protein ACM3JC_12780 [Rudaea sp.]
MNCVSCGKSIPGGARYCIHCGVEQAVPTPIAAVAAAGGLARVARREAANAAHAEPVRRVPDGAAETETLAQPTMNRGERDLERAATQPAYAGGPHRRGLAIALIAAAVVVAAIAWGIALWRSSSQAIAPSDEAASAARSEAPVPSQALSPPPEPAAAAPPAPESAAPAAEAPASPQAAQPATEPPVQIEPLPARAAPARRPAPKEAPARHTEAPAPPPASATAAAPVAPPAAAAAQPAPSRVADRWQRMEDEMSRCTREDFITRVICGQRVRFRYCDGYWGKVPQCPGSPSPERGQ